MPRKNSYTMGKLNRRSLEVQRLNMSEGIYPENLKRGQPSASIIGKREDNLRKGEY